MALSRSPQSKKRRAVLLAIGLSSLLATIYFLKHAPQFGISSLVFGIISLTASVIYLGNFAGYQLSSATLPNGLRRISNIYAVILCVWWLVGVIALVVEWKVTNFIDIAAILLLGMLSVTVWGTVAYVLLVIPLWYLAKLIRDSRK